MSNDYPLYLIKFWVGLFADSTPESCKKL